MPSVLLRVSRFFLSRRHNSALFTALTRELSRRGADETAGIEREREIMPFVVRGTLERGARANPSGYSPREKEFISTPRSTFRACFSRRLARGLDMMFVDLRARRARHGCAISVNPMCAPFFFFFAESDKLRYTHTQKKKIQKAVTRRNKINETHAFAAFFNHPLLYCPFIFVKYLALV